MSLEILQLPFKDLAAGQERPNTLHRDVTLFKASMDIGLQKEWCCVTIE